MNQLSDYGWNKSWQQKWTDQPMKGMTPARVIADFGTSLKIVTPHVCTAELSGKLAHYSHSESIPKVGDWVVVHQSDNQHTVIEDILPRRSEIARKAAGSRTVKQVIAANIDIAFVLLSLDNDFNIKRLQRFLYQLSVSKIKPVIVLNKADKTENLLSYTEQLATLELPIIVTTATEGKGIDKILSFISPGETAILLGSSGVGKSTITNRLLGRESQTTQSVRASDSKGKHTTVHRELFILPGGGLLIDTPGIRELQLWGSEDDLDENFDDVINLISRCHYSTCQHGSEKRCAIRDALTRGTLSAGHYENYLKLKAELSGLKEKRAVRAQHDNKKSKKSIRRQEQDTINDLREELRET